MDPCQKRNQTLKSLFFKHISYIWSIRGERRARWGAVAGTGGDLTGAWCHDRKRSWTSAYICSPRIETLLMFKMSPHENHPAQVSLLCTLKSEGKKGGLFSRRCSSWSSPLSVCSCFRADCATAAKQPAHEPTLPSAVQVVLQPAAQQAVLASWPKGGHTAAAVLRKYPLLVHTQQSTLRLVLCSTTSRKTTHP